MKLTPNGVYICEDAFTSYWPEYGGRLRQKNTFIEYAKDLVDDLHAFWIMDDEHEPGPITQITEGIHFYSGAVVFQRALVSEPVYVLRAGETFNSVSIEELKKVTKAKFQK